MSLLYRNGTGRNNVAWGGSISTAANYLRRTGTGKNDIAYLNISTSGTWNLLERTASGINSIRWKNITFSFLSFAKYQLGSMYVRLPNKYYNLKVVDDRGATSSSTFTYFCTINSVGVNSFNVSVSYRGAQDLSYMQLAIYFATKEACSGFMDEVQNNYTKVSILPRQYTQNLTWGSAMYGPYETVGDIPPNASSAPHAWYVTFNLGEHHMNSEYPTQVVFS